MQTSIRDLYLETEVNTATPQRLRLMLIEVALRQVRQAQDAVRQGDHGQALQATTRCRNLVAELLAGIQADQSAVAKDVLRVYLFLYSTLVEVEFASHFERLSDIQRILEEEQITWQKVCLETPERITKADAAVKGEELAPQRVGNAFDSAYGRAPAADSPVGLSIEA